MERRQVSVQPVCRNYKPLLSHLARRRRRGRRLPLLTNAECHCGATNVAISFGSHLGAGHYQRAASVHRQLYTCVGIAGIYLC